MHAHHAVDAFDCATGSHRLTQQLIHLDILRLPIGAQSTTKHAGHRHQLTPLHTVVTFGLLQAPERCLAPHSHLRGTIIPTPRQQGVDKEATDTGAPRWSWTRLLKRVFSLDMVRCPFCQ
jgi:hypothetical protein